MQAVGRAGREVSLGSYNVRMRSLQKPLAVNLRPYTDASLDI